MTHSVLPYKSDSENPEEQRPGQAGTVPEPCPDFCSERPAEAMPASFWAVL